MNTHGRPSTTRSSLAWLAAAALVLLADAALAKGQPAAPGAGRLVYRPPDLGAPPTRTLAAARGLGDQPSIQVLAPAQTGLTREAQPQLLWYLPAPSRAPIEVTLMSEEAIDPLLEIDLGPVAEAGIHALDLADYGVRLEPGVEYRWSVAQVIDPRQRSADALASATIAHQEPGPQLEGELAGAGSMAKLQALARHGYWYDLIALLSDEISKRPDEEELRRLRADLLDQQGLQVIAAYDRQGASSQ